MIQFCLQSLDCLVPNCTDSEYKKLFFFFCAEQMLVLYVWKQTACHACSSGLQQQHRLSGQSCESGVSSSSRQSYHSTASTGSSSSQGSLDRLEESGYSSTINVHELMRQGRSVRCHIASVFSSTCLTACD